MTILGLAVLGVIAPAAVVLRRRTAARPSLLPVVPTVAVPWQKMIGGGMMCRQAVHRAPVPALVVPHPAVVLVPAMGLPLVWTIALGLAGEA